MQSPTDPISKGNCRSPSTNEEETIDEQTRDEETSRRETRDEQTRDEETRGLPSKAKQAGGKRGDEIANGNDIFVVNGCAKEKVGGEKCTLHSHLIDYCNPRDYPHSFASCSQCYGKNCNLKDINLIRPADHSPRENHCIHAFRHNQSYEPDPALKEMVKEWNIKDYSDKFNLECGLGNVGCQTYRCKNGRRLPSLWSIN
uniref:SCP domain-containing protein n=1 Tax=Globodera pallida TaxID=36090 RepID=A0A183BYK6_GLOPA